VPGDALIVRWLRSHRHWFSTGIAGYISGSGAPAGVVPMDCLVLATLLVRRQHADARAWGLATGGAWLLHLLTKGLVGRKRPVGLASLQPQQTSSFPSGHAVHALAFLLALEALLRNTRWRRPVLLLGGPWVTIVGASRIVLAKHHPSDVMGAWLAVLVWCRAVDRVERSA